MYYKGIGPNRGQTVSESEAVDYVLSHCGISVDPLLSSEETEEALDVLVDWYFSGNWISEGTGEYQ